MKVPGFSPTHHALAPTTDDPAPFALSALKHGLQAPPKASKYPGMPSRTGSVQISPIISVIDTGGFETFEKEEIRAFHRSKSSLKLKNEVHSARINFEALSKTP